MLKPFIDTQKFRTEYSFYVFDHFQRKDNISFQPIGLEYKLSAAFGVTEHVAFALVLIRKVISTSSNGQKHFDLFLNKKQFENKKELFFRQIHDINIY